jgi:hypothetical protein
LPREANKISSRFKEIWHKKEYNDDNKNNKGKKE